MPFVLSYPARVPAAGPLEQMVTNVDLAQTILECAGVEPRSRMQGKSFWPQVTDRPDEPTRDAVYYRYYENDDVWHHALAHYGVRTERYKLIYFYNDGMGLPGTPSSTYPPEWELYDLREDPLELHNVYDDPRYREVREQLKVRLWQLQAELGDEPHHSQSPPALLTASVPAEGEQA